MDAGSLRTFMVLKGLLLSVLGLVFVIWPGEVAEGIAFWAGLLLLAVGIVSMIYTYRIHKTVPSTFLSYLVPVSALTGGLIFLLFPRFTLSIFALFIGLWILLEGIQQIRLSGSVEAMGRRPGNWMLGIGIVSLLIGLFIIFRPYDLIQAMTIFFGLLMLASGLFMIYTGARGH